MRKKLLTRALALSLCAVAAVPAAACSTKSGGGEAVDANRTQIRVYHYNAGYGQDWVYELKANFEAMMAEESFEEGKKGVQVHISGDMNARGAEQWRSEPYDVLFLEGPSEYYAMMERGVLLPLTSIMTTPNANDNNQTIEEKLSLQQRQAYQYDGEYYGIPHYSGHYGIIYNKDLFDQRGFYIAAERDDDGNLLISAENPKKSAGLDGIEGTDDDGLPRTYDEFYEFCIEIDANGVDPLCWPGEFYHQHTMLFMDNLVASNMGAEQMNLNYTFTGTANDLVVFDSQGNIVVDEDGDPVTEDGVEITDANAYELSRQLGKYQAFQFMETILKEKAHYNEKDGIEDNKRSHTEMQQLFLENGATSNARPNAMLLDGCWWQMEATTTFDRMTRQDEKWSKQNRNFGWMQLPQPTEADAQAIANGTKKSVYLDYLRATACIKANLPSDGVKDACLKFMQYVYTDEALANFTYTTGTTIGVEYLDAVDRSRLTPYETSLINYIEKSEIISQMSGTKKYAVNVEAFSPSKRYSVAGYAGAIEAFAVSNISAEDYFKLHQSAFKGIAWGTN